MPELSSNNYSREEAVACLWLLHGAADPTSSTSASKLAMGKCHWQGGERAGRGGRIGRVVPLRLVHAQILTLFQPVLTPAGMGPRKLLGHHDAYTEVSRTFSTNLLQAS